MSRNVIDFEISATGYDRSSKNKIKIFTFHNIKMLGGYDYKEGITIEVFNNGLSALLTSGKLLPTDEISQMGWTQEEEPQVWRSDRDDPPRLLWYFIIQVGRYTIETDDQYAERQSEIYKNERLEESKQKELYLRLKARFEPHET